MTASIHNQVFVSTPLAEPACRAAHTLCTSPGTQDLIPSTELAASSPTFPSAMEQPPVLCLEQGHRDCAQQPSPPAGKEDSLPQHTHNWFFPYSQAAGSRLGRYCWLCLVVDPPVHTGQSPFQQPQQQQGDGRSWLGPGQGWAGAGAPQGGICARDQNFQGSIH